MSRSTDRQNCDVVHQLVEAFVDGDLGPAEERMVATHVDGCETCARELRTAREVRSALRSLPEHDAPATVLWAVRMATRDDSATAPVPAG